MTWVGDLEGTPYTPTLAYTAMVGPARGYAIAAWQSSNTVHFTPDDRAAIASLALTETIDRVRTGDLTFESWPYLWVSVKSRIDTEMSHELRKWMNKPTATFSISPRPDNPTFDPGDVFTSLRAKHRDGLLQKQLADIIAILPTENKIALALRFFERKSLGQIGGMIGASEKPARTWITGNTRYLLHHAKRLVLDHGPDEDVRVPRVGEDYRAPLRAAATSYVERTYGCDLASWLGWVQISYRLDVSYLLDMLDVSNGIQLKTVDPKFNLNDDADIIDRLPRPPANIADVMEMTGWKTPRARHALATWRLRHDIDAPKNGSAARKQARNFAACCRTRAIESTA